MFLNAVYNRKLKIRKHNLLLDYWTRVQNIIPFPVQSTLLHATYHLPCNKRIRADVLGNIER